MKSIINIGLDFHGTTFDHRLAKYLFFKNHLGISYSDPYIDRNKIIEELESLGYSRDWYFDSLKDFFNSEWSLSGEISAGLDRFLSAAPEHWRFIVLSGMSSNILSIRRIIAYSDLTRIAGIYRVADSKKADVSAQLNIKLYFDDKPDIIPSFVEKGIKCIQVSTEEYSEYSPKAALHFNNWNDIADSMPKVRGLID